MPKLYLVNGKLELKTDNLDKKNTAQTIIRFLQSTKLKSPKKTSTVSSDENDSIEIHSQNAQLLIEELSKKNYSSCTAEEFSILKAKISPENQATAARLIQPLANYNASTFYFFKHHVPDSKKALTTIKEAFFKMCSEKKSDEDRKPVEDFLSTIAKIRNGALRKSIAEQKPLYGGYVESLQNIINGVTREYGPQEPSPPGHMIKNHFSYLTPLEKYSSSRLKITKHYLQESKAFLNKIKPRLLDFVLKPDANQAQALLETINKEISAAVVKAVAAGRDFTSQGGYIDLLIKFKEKILVRLTDPYNLITMEDSLTALKQEYPKMSSIELSKKMNEALGKYKPAQINEEEFRNSSSNERKSNRLA